MRTDYVHFPERAARSKYIAVTFRHYIGDSLLDVGCDRAVLRTLLDDDVRYTGVDIGGNPDYRIDLERVERLPFSDQAFDTTVCSDVLEHLDNLHHVFSELVRVTRRHLIVSLPNNWANARRPIERGRGSIAHYGLPVTRPTDRHKWFFNFSEAADFLCAQAERFALTPTEFISNEKPRWPVVRALRHLRYLSSLRYRNRYAHTVWAILTR